MLFSLLGAAAAVTVGVYFLTAPGGTAGDPQMPPAIVEQAEEVTAPKVPVAELTFAQPVRLIIPKIGVDAAIEKVGLTDDGAMASPSGPATVGWYKFGPRPGNRGSAVLDGHSGYRDGQEAVFDDLPQLVKGDKLFIEDARGERIPFIVRTTKLYARDASAAEVFAKTSSSRLNLITCTGSFDVAADTHSKRLVVFAELRLPDGVSVRQ